MHFIILQLSRLLIAVTLLSVGPFGCAPKIAQITPDFIEPVTSMEFVFVEGGTFQMGDFTGAYKRELPVHQVTLPGFGVGMHEVTFAQYDEFCEANNLDKPSDEGWGRGNRPVINVSWHDANAYANWMSKETDLRFSLPSEAQWEYFARAGTISKFWWGDKIKKKSANCRSCNQKKYPRQTAPVGSYPPNPWGLFDTAGNVAEWTLDNYKKDYSQAPDDGTVSSAGDPAKKIIRGGAWRDETQLTSSSRDWENVGGSDKSVGFRLIFKAPKSVISPQN